MQNNRQIVFYIFDEEEESGGKQPKKRKNGKSLKDQIIEKISNKTDMKMRHLAIEFMIELC